MLDGCPIRSERIGGGAFAPRWLVFSSLGLTLLILVMAVAETTLWTHFLVDRGERLALAGLAFIFPAGLLLHRREQLLTSWPLLVPWLIYPVVTQGDQIIDNLTINQMRIVCHLILAVLFAAPIAVLTLAARHLRLIDEGRTREGSVRLVLCLLFLEMWVAHRYLGKLMLMTLIAMTLAFLGLVLLARRGSSASWSRTMRKQLALVAFLVSVAASFGLYWGFKNRPGVYQGSPHHFHDPSWSDAFHPLAEIPVPAGRATAPAPELAEEVSGLLVEYGQVMQSLSHAYYVLDRNYNYAFHNALFLRHTPVVAGFREIALDEIARAHDWASRTDARLARIEAALPPDGHLLAFLRDIRDNVAYSFDRAAILEEMSGRFERTEAGLQHATHLYEGEGKILGVRLMEIVEKHRALQEAPLLSELVGPFVNTSHEVHDMYANRIVGF
jgi:hypothetical protein